MITPTVDLMNNLYLINKFTFHSCKFLELVSGL